MVPVREYMRENADNQVALEKGGSEVPHSSQRLPNVLTTPPFRDTHFGH